MNIKSGPENVTPFAIETADKLALAVIKLIRNKHLDSRSEAADRLLEYANLRFGGSNPIRDLEDFYRRS